MISATGGRSGKGRTRTLPGKYVLGSWQSLAASDAQKALGEEILATGHVMVIRCVYRQGTEFAAHLHEQEQITIVEDGCLEFLVNGDTLKVEAGQMISIFPGVLHASRVCGEKPARALNLFYAAQVQPRSARTKRLARVGGRI